MYKKYKKILSIYGSHDASVTFIDKSGNISVLEYERFVKKRYAMYTDSFDHRVGIGSNKTERESFLKYLLTQMMDTELETILYNELSPTDIIHLQLYFPAATFVKVGHHTAHAASGYYTSPFNDALIISIDGGGNENESTVFTKMFAGVNSDIKSISNFNIEFGNPYSMIGSPISEIKPGPDSDTHSLSYAGKVMGLCAYGKVRPEWVASVKHFYTHQDMNILGKNIGLNLNFNNLSGQDGYDLAATSQYVFEELFFETFWDKIVESNLNVILVGGCALNVLLNQKLKEKLSELGRDVYIPSNPNDCGLSLGQFLYFIKEKIDDNIVYNGFEILDIDDLMNYFIKYNPKKCDVGGLVSLLKDGKIIGIINDGSEIGPRALGNRSIICNPAIKDMKDVLNKKVKFREWFRPFAPVCRSQDKDLYFDKAYDSKFMSYAPNVKDEYKEKLCSITHVDGTARLQTVKKNDHKLFYNILTNMEKVGMIPVILNTSFNIKGYPILTTLNDALYVLENTELDYVYSQGYLFSKLS